MEHKENNMKRYYIGSLAILSLVLVLGLFGCAPTQINGGGTLPSKSGTASDKANFGFSANNCTPGAMTGEFNYHDKNAPGWPNGGVKFNGTIFDAGKCSEFGSFGGYALACTVCNLQFCNGSGWPNQWESYLSSFLADPLGFCPEVASRVPNNLYAAAFQFKSTNPRYPGSGTGVVCLRDNGQGKKAIDKDHVTLIIGPGQYYGYTNQGPVQGNVSSGPCCHDLCVSGFPPASSCDPCIAQVCAVDAHCCTTAWDSSCIEQAVTTCALICAQ
jgi:hypothetical protein